MGERAGLLANGLTDNKDLKDEQTQKRTQIKLDKLNVQGGELLFEQLILTVNTTLNAKMIFFLSFLSLFSDPPFLGGSSHYIVSFYTTLITHLFII